MQSGPYKYINAPRAELYDLSKDPAERNNILPAYPDEVRSLKTQIDDLMARYPPKRQASRPEISENARQMLGSLGYTAGGRQSPQTQAPDPKDKLAEQEAYESGLTLLYSGQYDKAILTLQRIVTQDARNLPALCALGEAYLRSGNSHAELLRYAWQQALERNPKYFPAAESIGEYWLARKDYDKACRFLPTAAQCKGRQ